MAARITLLVLCVAMTCALAYLGRCKRPDVGWGKFIAAGPLVFLQPARFMRPEHQHVPSRVLLLFASLFLVAFVLAFLGL